MGLIFSNNKILIFILIVLIILIYAPDKILQKVPLLWDFKLFVKNTFSEMSDMTSGIIDFFKKNVLNDAQTTIKDNTNLFQGFDK